ncbi:MFS transporter [Microbacterium resistens]|uniref:CynX/NimT family MFS transporter n=1 Tax=Microbacterium resistens TaxID=156977 RepID=UPI001C55BD62|nr:MFS transporter [Microbacterium resistens]MBW1639031.1 MFS transporter [Microbacterium resistens]
MLHTDTLPASTHPRRTRIRPSALLVLIGILLVAGNLRAAITTVGPVLPEIARSTQISSLLSSALISLPLVAFALVSPIAPRIAHRLGLERTIGISLLLLVAGLIARSTPPLALLWIGTALIGVSIAILNVVLPALIKRDFPDKIAQVTGGYSAVQSTFAAVAAGIAAPLAAATALGWRLPLGMWAGLALISLGVFAPQLRRRTVLTASEEDIALELPKTHHATWRSPWTSMLGWQVTLFMGLQSLIFYSLITWLPSIEAAAGIRPHEINIHQFVLNALGVLASLACSVMIPRMRDQRLLAVTGPLLTAAGLAGIYFAPQLALAWICILGFAAGVNVVLALSFFGLRTTHHSQAASLSGMAQTLGYLVAAAGPLAFGALHDTTGDWTPILTGLIAISMILAALGYLSGRSRVIDNGHRAGSRP